METGGHWGRAAVTPKLHLHRDVPKVTQGPGKGLVLGTGRGRAGQELVLHPELFVHPSPRAARDGSRGAGAQGFPSATIPSAGRLQPAPGPLCHLLFYVSFTPNHPFHQGEDEQGPGYPFDPRVALLVKPPSAGGTRTEAMFAMPITLFQCRTRSSGLLLLLPGTGIGLCTILPAPSITAAHVNTEEAPSPKN